MLKKYNDDFFNNKGITEKGVILFLQRWAEIFDQRTLSTYQYSIINIVYGIQEYLETINKTLDGSFTTYDNVESCRVELLRAFKEDNIICKYKPNLSGQVKSNLGKPINSKKDDTSGRATLLRIKHEISYALNIIKPNYQNWLMDELLKNIKNLEIREIQLNIKALASYCIYSGWTPNGASNLVNRLFTSKENFVLDTVWNEFKNALNQKQEFTVYVNLKLGADGFIRNGDETISLIESLGIVVHRYNEILQRHPQIPPQNFPINSDKKYMLCQVEAKDPKAAALNCMNILVNKITILAFYNKIFPLSLNDLDVFVVNNTTNYIKKFKTNELYKTTLFQDTSNKVFENTMRLYSDANEELKSTKIALNGVFNYVNISLLSVFPEEKFMNLWIALESFMRTGQYSNIISHIKEVLPSVVCKRYIYRLIRNFSADCLRCKVFMNLSTELIDLNNDSKQEVVEKLITAIKNDNSYNEMKSLCSVNFLLVNRLEELKEILADNFSVISKIRKYYETTLWHIQRLYRIRNEIAHSALKDDNYLITYIEHLFDYLSILIAEIVFICSEKQIKSIEEIFPFLKDNYESFNSTADHKKSLVVEFQLTNGIIDFL